MDAEVTSYIQKTKKAVYDAYIAVRDMDLDTLGKDAQPFSYDITSRLVAAVTDGMLLAPNRAYDLADPVREETEKIPDEFLYHMAYTGLQRTYNHLCDSKDLTSTLYCEIYASMNLTARVYGACGPKFVPPFKFGHDRPCIISRHQEWHRLIRRILDRHESSSEDSE